MGVRFVIVVAALGLVARAAQAQCTKDVDCKGDRICEGGTCVNPPPSPCACPAAAEAPAVVKPAVAEKKKLVLTPGIGLYDLAIGRASPKEVLARFPGTPDIRRVNKDGRTTKDPDGRVSRIVYSTNDSPDAPTDVPQVFTFDERERLETIVFSDRQRDIEVQGGIRADLPPPDVRRLAGEPGRVVTVIVGMVEEWIYDDGFKVRLRTQGRPVVTGIEIIAPVKR